MTTNLAKTPQDQQLMAAVEQAITTGNLMGLTPPQRLFYYNQVCESVGLNPITRPLDFIQLNGKLVLYAKKDATDQLRKINQVSIVRIEQAVQGDCCVVTAYAKDKNGKEDSDMGAVPVGALKGEAYANAIMKCVTKAKRRVTLSICGMGCLDESELDTVSNYTFDPIDMGTKTAAKTDALKEKLLPAPVANVYGTVAMDERAAANQVAAGNATLRKEPEVLPPVRKPGRPPGVAAQARAAAVAPPVATTPPPAPTKTTTPPGAVDQQEMPPGDAQVPFGKWKGKRLDDLENDEVRAVAAYYASNPKPSTPHFVWFKGMFDIYFDKFEKDEAEFNGMTSEPEEVPPPPTAEMQDMRQNDEKPEEFFNTRWQNDEKLEEFFNTPSGGVDHCKVAIDRLKNAKTMPELQSAWTQLFADAKDEKKINLKAMPPAAAAEFNKTALAEKANGKARLSK